MPLFFHLHTSHSVEQMTKSLRTDYSVPVEVIDASAGNPLTGMEPLMPVLLPLLVHPPMSVMPALSSLNPHSTCTAGVRTLSLPLSSNLTDRTDSLNVKAPTSMLSSHTSTTPDPPDTGIVHSPSHSPEEHQVIRHLQFLQESTTPLFARRFSLLSAPARPPRSVFMPPTTMSFVSCPVWEALHTQTKRNNIHILAN